MTLVPSDERKKIQAQVAQGCTDGDGASCLAHATFCDQANQKAAAFQALRRLVIFDCH